MKKDDEEALKRKTMVFLRAIRVIRAFRVTRVIKVSESRASYDYAVLCKMMIQEANTCPNNSLSINVVLLKIRIFQSGYSSTKMSSHAHSDPRPLNSSHTRPLNSRNISL